MGDVPLSVETRVSGAAWFEVMRRPSGYAASFTERVNNFETVAFGI
jgi:hypothetical protein